MVAMNKIFNVAGGGGGAPWVLCAQGPTSPTASLEDDYNKNNLHVYLHLKAIKHYTPADLEIITKHNPKG
jgi:hypothetical protein